MFRPGFPIKTGVLTLVYLLIFTPLQAQHDTTYRFEEVRVNAGRAPAAFSEAARQLNVLTRKDIQAAGFVSLDEAISFIGPIDQRRRGPGGIQSDISINGGTYEQVMVMLNGINISDPQTGHFHMDIPVPLSSVERIEVISGAAAHILGPNAYAGAINIVTRTDSMPALDIGSQVGQYKYRNVDFYAGTGLGDVDLGLSSQYSSTGGYTHNTDSRNGSAYVTGSYARQRQLLSWQAGANKKAFGANSFYSPAYPDQYEETASLVSSLSWKNEGRIGWRQDIYARYHEDEFHLFRHGSPSWYKGPNNHLSRVLGSSHNFWFHGPWGSSSAGAALRMETLWSNVLGDSLDIAEYRMLNTTDTLSLGAGRRHASLFASHRFVGSRFSLSGGIVANLLRGSSAGFYVFPGLDMSYRLYPDLKIYAGISQSLRLPGFTEMYYSSPTHNGNPHLQPETAWDYRLGARLARSGYLFSSLVSARWSENSIDWVRSHAGEPWVSMNVTGIFSLNVDVSISLNDVLPGGMSMKFAWHYIWQDKDDSGLDSRYLMDYLRHKLSWQSGLRFLGTGRITLDLYLADRAGDYTDWDSNGNPFQQSYLPFFLTDVRAMWGMGRTSFTLSANNLFNTRYADIGHIWQPGRWLKLGLEYNLQPSPH